MNHLIYTIISFNLHKVMIQEIILLFFISFQFLSENTEFNIANGENNNIITYNNDVANNKNEEITMFPNFLSKKNRVNSDLKSGYHIIPKDFNFFSIPPGYDNSVWEIIYDFNFDGGTLIIPENVKLFFNGGRFINVTLIGVSTSVESSFTYEIFKDVALSGKWSVNKSYPEWFGAKVDGKTNDTESINKAISIVDLSGGGTVYLISEGVYKVFPISNIAITDTENPFYWGCLELKDNITLQSKKGTKILGDSNFTGHIYDPINRNKAIFTFKGNNSSLPPPTRDVSIFDVTIEGGYNGITACNVDNLLIERFKSVGNSLDGIYIGFPGQDIPNNPTNIFMKKIHIDGCRRNGISILRGKYIYLDGFLAENIKGQAPQAGFDIEPEIGALVEHVFFKNIESYNNVVGAEIICWESGRRRCKNISIENMNLSGNTMDDFNIQYGNEIYIKNVKIKASGTRYKGFRVYKGFNMKVDSIKVFKGGVNIMLQNSTVSNILVEDSPNYGVKFSYAYGQFKHLNNKYSNFIVKNTQKQAYYITNAERTSFANFMAFNSNLAGLDGNMASAMTANNIKNCQIIALTVDSDAKNKPVSGVYVASTASINNVASGCVVSNVSGRPFKLFWDTTNSFSNNNIEVPSAWKRKK